MTYNSGLVQTSVVVGASTRVSPSATITEVLSANGNFTAVPAGKKFVITSVVLGLDVSSRAYVQFVDDTPTTHLFMGNATAAGIADCRVWSGAMTIVEGEYLSFTKSAGSASATISYYIEDV